MSDQTKRTVASMEADYYCRRLAAVADGLRKLADHVEHEGTPRPTVGTTGTPRFSQAAYSAFHAITWGLANLNAESLIDAAGRADASAEEARL